MTAGVKLVNKVNSNIIQLDRGWVIKKISHKFQLSSWRIAAIAVAVIVTNVFLKK